MGRIAEEMFQIRFESHIQNLAASLDEPESAVEGLCSAGKGNTGIV